MLQVIYHFNLQNKKVMSIGSAWGLEEFWLYQKGCILTLIDIDLPNLFEDYLKKLTLNGTMRYIVADINEVVEGFNDKFDLIYTSGLHETLLWTKEGFSKLIYKCIKTFIETGLFICQSYHGGLKMNKSNSIKKIKKQCKQEGLHLISVHCFFPIYRRVSLITIFKGSKKNLKEYLDSIKGNPEITRFHGRSELNPIVKEVYHYE